MERLKRSERWFSFLESVGTGLQINISAITGQEILASLPPVCPACGRLFPPLSLAEMTSGQSTDKGASGVLVSYGLEQTIPMPLWDGLSIAVRECPCSVDRDIPAFGHRADTAGRLLQSFQATLADSITVGKASAELTALRQLNLIVLSMFHGESGVLAKALDLILSALIVLLDAKASWLVLDEDYPGIGRLIVKGDRAAVETCLACPETPPAALCQNITGPNVHGHLAVLSPEDAGRSARLLPMMVQECAIIFEIDRLYNLVKAQLTTILGALGDPILLLDKECQVIFANEAAGTLFGASAIDLIGRSSESLEVSWADSIKRWLVSGRSQDFFCQDSRGRILDWRLTSLGDESKDRIAGWLAIAKDRTEYYRWQETGRFAESYSALTSVIGTLAHELRNPLAATKALLQLARRKKEPEKIAGYIDLVLHEIDRVSALTDEFLQMNRTKPLNTEWVNLAMFLNDLMPLLAADAAESGVELAQAFKGAPSVQADTGQLTQVLLNLSRNAIEAAGRGGHVEIALSVSDSWAVIKFRDSGAGILSEHAARIFMPFFTTKEKGTGLGLAIAKSIVDRHRGRIAAENHPEGGAVFSVMLPVPAGRDKPIAVDFLVFIHDELLSYPIEHTLKASGFSTAMMPGIDSKMHADYRPVIIVVDEVLDAEGMHIIQTVWPYASIFMLGNGAEPGARYFPKPVDYSRLIEDARRIIAVSKA